MIFWVGGKNCILKNEKCIKFLESQYVNLNPESNDWQGEKDGKMGIQKFEYLENENSFLDEIKPFFIVFKSHYLMRNKK